MKNYKPYPIYFEKGKGIYLYTKKNEEYIDAISGIGVCCLGHGDKKITKVISKQANKLLHTSNIYEINKQKELAKNLCKISSMKSVFFCNSGSEANETAMKLARLHANKNNLKNPKMIVFKNGWHGRSFMTLAATSSESAKKGFSPLPGGFITLPLNDINEIHKVIKLKQVSAIMIEVVQGEGGINISEKKFLKKLRDITKKKDILLIIDEVQTGIGRTGKWFAYQNFGIIPDIVTSAKGLGNGIPIGACMGNQKVSKLFEPGSHGSTFGGNPFVSTISLEVLKIIKERNLLDHVNEMGKFFINQLKDDLGNLKIVREIRGMGLMIGIELKKPNLPVVKDCLEKQNLLLNLTSSNIVRMLPPLIIKKEQLKTISKKLKFVLESYE